MKCVTQMYSLRPASDWTDHELFADTQCQFMHTIKFDCSYGNSSTHWNRGTPSKGLENEVDENGKPVWKIGRTAVGTKKR